MTGTYNLTKNEEEIELAGNEKLSFSKFLAGKSQKIVNLDRILGIGGEGIVIAQKIDIRENHYKRGWKEKKGREVALKFVKFEKNDDEDFMGPEEEDESGGHGGINGNGKWVESQFFERLYKLGDFRAATWLKGGYSRPTIDFGISQIHQKYYNVLGKLFINKNKNKG